MSPQITA